MSAENESFNPFQAPVVREVPEQRLADDQQFLISNRDIICRDKVVLPPLCIHTGEIENLEIREKRLYAPAAAPMLFIVVIAVVAIAGILQGLNGLSFAAVIIGVLVVGVLTNRRLGFLPWSLAHTVDATWYVSQRYLRRVYWEKLAARIVLIGFGGAVGSLGAMPSTSSSGAAQSHLLGTILAILIGGAAGLGLSFTLQMEKPLTLRGPRYLGLQKGLMVLQGHSRHFAENAQRVADGGFSS